MTKFNTRTLHVSNMGEQLLAILTWGEDLKVYVRWIIPLSQMDIDGNYISDSTVDDVRKFCESKNLNLWSY